MDQVSVNGRRGFLRRLVAVAAAPGAIAAAEPPAATAIASTTTTAPTATGAEDRAYWRRTLFRVARPSQAWPAAPARIPVSARPARSRNAGPSHLKAVGRTLAGVAPWRDGSPRRCGGRPPGAMGARGWTAPTGATIT